MCELELTCPSCDRLQEVYVELADGPPDKGTHLCQHCETEIVFNVAFDPVIVNEEVMPACKLVHHEFKLKTEKPQCGVFECIHCGKLDYRWKNEN